MAAAKAATIYVQKATTRVQEGCHVDGSACFSTLILPPVFSKSLNFYQAAVSFPNSSEDAFVRVLAAEHRLLRKSLAFSAHRMAKIRNASVCHDARAPSKPHLLRSRPIFENPTNMCYNRLKPVAKIAHENDYLQDPPAENDI